MIKWYGYLFDTKGCHGSGTPLFSVEDAFNFCLKYWRTNYEVRIVDPTEEYTAMQAINGELIVPITDGLQRIPLVELERKLGGQSND